MIRKISLTTILFILLIIFYSCDFDDKVKPTSEPTPTAVPTVTPTPTGPWGYTSGRAEVEVSNLPENPYREKEVIFCLGNPDNENWVNVRHRSGNKFQLKGGLDPESRCVDDVHYNFIQPAGNGTWIVEWDENGNVTVTSPAGGVEQLHIEGGKYAFRGIYKGSCGGYIPYSSPAEVTVISIEGNVGYPTDCSY